MTNNTRAALELASIRAAELVGALSKALDSSGRDTATPGEVVAIVDDTLRQLHKTREGAIGESRRRLDAAMDGRPRCWASVPGRAGHADGEPEVVADCARSFGPSGVPCCF